MSSRCGVYFTPKERGCVCVCVCVCVVVGGNTDDEIWSSEQRDKLTNECCLCCADSGHYLNGLWCLV